MRTSLLLLATILWAAPACANPVAGARANALLVRAEVRAQADLHAAPRRANALAANRARTPHVAERPVHSLRGRRFAGVTVRVEFPWTRI